MLLHRMGVLSMDGHVRSLRTRISAWLQGNTERSVDRLAGLRHALEPLESRLLLIPDHIDGTVVVRSQSPGIPGGVRGRSGGACNRDDTMPRVGPAGEEKPPALLRSPRHQAGCVGVLNRRGVDVAAERRPGKQPGRSLDTAPALDLGLSSSCTTVVL